MILRKLYYKHLNNVLGTIRRLLLLCITMLCSIAATAAGIHFEQIDTRGHTVYCMCRDADDVVWVGTSNGLTTLAQLQGSFPFIYTRHEALSQIIHSIRQDNTKRLWLTTHTDHLLVYDAHLNKVITDVPGYLKQLGMPDINERLTVVDPQGKLWTSNGKTIYCYDFSKKELKKTSIPANSGNIMALQYSGDAIIAVTANHVYGIDKSSLRIEHIGPTPQTITTHHIIMVRDKLRNLWIATDNKLFQLSEGSSQWTDISDVHHVKGIVATQSGQTVVATSNYGLYIFDPTKSSHAGERRAFQHLTQTPPNIDGLQSNHIESLYYNENLHAIVIGYNKGNISIATPKGEKYDIYSLATAANQYHPEDIISFSPAKDEHAFWAGSEDGGMFLVENSANMTILENRHRGSSVVSIFTDSQKRMWTGIYNEGLLTDDGRRLFPGDSPYSIVQPIAGGRLFVALLGKGIVSIDPQTGKTENIPTDNPWINNLASHNGLLYAVTNDYIYEINAATLAQKHIPLSALGPKNKMLEGQRRIFVDKHGWLWALSNINHSPIYIYETTTGKTHTLKEMEKYIVSSICADKNNNIWCTTDQGLVRITTDGSHFSYSKYLTNIQNGFHYNVRALYALPDGNMVAGTDGGFIRFNPQLLAEDNERDKPSQSPIITMLRINGVIQQPYSEDNKHENGIEGDIIYVKELNLSHEEKNLVVGCRPRGFMTETADPYYYNLKGYSKEWLPVANERIVLSNLPPGKYELMVSTSPTGDDTAEQFHLLNIHIRPPFWRSLWGMAIWTVLGALLCAGLYRYFRNKRNYRREIRRIEQQKKQEEELNKMKTQFFTNVSHDLRTPLTLIIAPVDELISRFSKQHTEGNTLKMLTTVKKNATHLLSLVNQMLDVRLLEAPYEKLQTSPTDIGDMLRQLTEAYTAQAEKRGIDFSISLPDEQHIVNIDNDKLSKIVNNLLSNSFKFTPDNGSISLAYTLKPTDNGNRLTLRVADSGNGISEKDLPHIFERFYYSQQLHSSHESSGIGLSIVKQYTELMGGTVTAANNQPHGAVFTISIPVEEAALSPVTNTQHPNPATILIVDDNTDLLSFMTSSLQSEHNVLTASSGEEALEILYNEQTDIDVVVSDVMMTGIDGLELTRRIKEDINLCHIPVILLTAKALEEDELKGLQMGANDYITKPFNIDILRLRINSWMQRRQSAREVFSSQSDEDPEALGITTIDQQLLQNVISVINDHMHEPDFNVDQLASIIGLHRTGLNRKLKFITGQTPIIFIRTMRLKRARKIMEADPSLPVSQVAYKVGFNNPKIFSRYFSEEFGCKPSEYVRNEKNTDNG